jgi:hypothetical protein
MLIALRLLMGSTVTWRPSPPLVWTSSHWASSSQPVTFCAVPAPLPAGNQVVSVASRPSRLNVSAVSWSARQTDESASSQPLVSSSSSLST